MVSESGVTWATYVPILVFLHLSVLDLGQMYATDRRQTSDAHHRLMTPTLGASFHHHLVARSKSIAVSTMRRQEGRSDARRNAE